MKVKSIPEEYLWSSQTRKLSPEEHSYRNKKESEFECPNCGHKSLYDRPFTPDSALGPKYVVSCDYCDWECPVEELSDCGEAIAEFKEWYAAWTMMGRPKAFVNQNCSRFFFPKENELLKALEADDSVAHSLLDMMTGESSVLYSVMSQLLKYCQTYTVPQITKMLEVLEEYGIKNELQLKTALFEHQSLLDSAIAVMNNRKKENI